MIDDEFSDKSNLPVFVDVLSGGEGDWKYPYFTIEQLGDCCFCS